MGVVELEISGPDICFHFLLSLSVCVLVRSLLILCFQKIRASICSAFFYYYLLLTNGSLTIKIYIYISFFFLSVIFYVSSFLLSFILSSPHFYSERNKRSHVFCLLAGKSGTITLLFTSTQGLIFGIFFFKGTGRWGERTGDRRNRILILYCCYHWYYSHFQLSSSPLFISFYLWRCGHLR